MNDEILNIIGNKKMTFDEIEVYFSDSSSLKDTLDELVDKNILSFEDGSQENDNQEDEYYINNLVNDPINKVKQN